jgi:hypothetical protein
MVRSRSASILQVYFGIHWPKLGLDLTGLGTLRIRPYHSCAHFSILRTCNHELNYTYWSYTQPSHLRSEEKGQKEGVDTTVAYEGEPSTESSEHPDHLEKTQRYSYADFMGFAISLEFMVK